MTAGHARVLLGSTLLLAGIVLLLTLLPWHGSASPFRYTELPTAKALPQDSGGAFAALRILRYAVEHRQHTAQLEFVEYQDAAGRLRRAPLPASAATLAAWQGAGRAIRAHTPENALFLAWWDDAQRVHFFSGRESFTARPVPGAFPDAHQAAFWGAASGPAAEDANALARTARWLSQDAASALPALQKDLPRDREIYLLAGTDTLARLGEIEALAGTIPGLQSRAFPGGEDFHARIAAVQRWAGEDGSTGEYLIQPPLAGEVLRAWRATPAARNTLLARLLPFTHNLDQPPEGLELVYQSEHALLTIYRLKGIP